MDSYTFDERINPPQDDRANENKGQFESSIVFWNFADCQNPHQEVKLWSPVDITIFEIHPENPDLVVAGAYNGQIIVYNKSNDAQLMTTSSSKEVKTLKYKAISPPDNSHRAPVTDIKFLPMQMGYRRTGERNNANTNFLAAKNYVFFMTVGFDGQVYIWDSKQEPKAKDQVQEVPFYPDKTKSIVVTNPDGEELGLLNINFEPDFSNRSFWTTTVINLKRIGRKKEI